MPATGTSHIPVQQMVEAEPSEPAERTNIFFLKAHKCASSTLQNILLRFGLERDLTFVLPSIHNYIGNPHYFSADLIDDSLATQNGKYHIFAHHSRYYHDQVRSVMYEDAAFVTILRHPAQVYESIYDYYKFQRVYNLSFEDFLSLGEIPKKFENRYFDRIGFNQMSFDLGFDEEDFNDSEKVDEFVKKIDREFDLVLMSEWMDASLVLLAEMMNWPLENVMSLKLNSRAPDSIYKMSEEEEKRVLELNRADYVLYTHFLNKFKSKIKEYGEDRMKRDIERLLALNTRLHFRCVQSLNMKGFGHTQAYKLRDEGDRKCFYAARGELPFTDELRNLQKHRVKVLNKLDVLLNS